MMSNNPDVIEARQREYIVGVVEAMTADELRPRLRAALEALDRALEDLRDEGHPETAYALARKAGLPYPHRVLDYDTGAVVWEGEEGKVPPPLGPDEHIW
jgi:hypothetical protein